MKKRAHSVSPRFWAALPLALLMVFQAGSSPASDRNGDVADAEVISAKRYGDDVSAFYLGLSAGYGGEGDDRFGLRTPAGTTTVGDLTLSGSYGGIRGGWRGSLPISGRRNYVYGLELGYDFGSLEDSVSTQVGSVAVTGSSEISDILSVRFRNGVTNRGGNILYFVSLGYVQGDVTTSNSFGPVSRIQSFEESDQRGGFSVSVGAEHFLSDNWSITGEYEFVQFQSKDVTFDSGFSTKSTPKYQGLRFGLNYRF